MYNTTNNQLSNKNEGFAEQLEAEQAQSAQNEQKSEQFDIKNWNDIAVNNPLNKCIAIFVGEWLQNWQLLFN